MIFKPSTYQYNSNLNKEGIVIILNTLASYDNSKSKFKGTVTSDYSKLTPIFGGGERSVTPTLRLKISEVNNRTQLNISVAFEGRNKLLCFVGIILLLSTAGYIYYSESSGPITKSQFWIPLVFALLAVITITLSLLKFKEESLKILQKELKLQFVQTRMDKKD